jgi:Porin subfamily
MNMKGVVLGVAGALAVTGAQAADLPAAPEPVDYVRVCDAFGTGFLYVPGTETCFQIRGRVRADYRTGFFGGPNFSGMSWNRNSSPGYNFFARAYVYSDSRTNTEFGLLRTYSQIEVTTQTTRGNATAVSLDQAYIQFGGLTAGKYYSFFNFTTGTVYGAGLHLRLRQRLLGLAVGRRLDLQPSGHHPWHQPGREDAGHRREPPRRPGLGFRPVDGCPARSSEDGQHPSFEGRAGLGYRRWRVGQPADAGRG